MNLWPITILVNSLINRIMHKIKISLTLVNLLSLHLTISTSNNLNQIISFKRDKIYQYNSNSICLIWNQLCKMMEIFLRWHLLNRYLLIQSTLYHLVQELSLLILMLISYAQLSIRESQKFLFNKENLLKKMIKKLMFILMSLLSK